MQISVPLSDTPALVDRILQDVLSHAREDVGAFLGDLLSRLQDHAPVDKGRFRGSLYPWMGEPGTWQPPEVAAMAYPVAGDPEVDRVVAGWIPGQPIGLASNVPYANRLAHGWSKQAPPGWIETEIAGAIASAERRAA